jgi:hypothetical protein
MSKELPKTICPHPWQHLHSWPDGKAMLCCVAHGGVKGGEVGDFSKNSYVEIMNSDKMKQIRSDFLAGKKPPECKACWEAEDLGKQSFRSNTPIHKEVRQLMEETDADGTMKETKMFYMDYRFSNLCNLGCQTCGSPLSSTIANNRENNSYETDFLKRKKVLSERGTVTSFVYARPNFMEEDVYPYLDDCRGFYFAGGEPLMHQEHLDILNYLNDNKLYDKTISYSTNLSLLKWKGINFLDIWKNFNNIMFWCSIDGHGKQLEYIREFSKHDRVFKNLDTLLKLKESPNPDKPFQGHQVRICYTHSLYNCYYVREFVDFLYENGFLDRLSDIELNYAYGDSNCPSSLPNFAKEELKAKRKEDREAESMQYIFKKFPKFKQYYDTVDTLLDSKSNNYSFDLLCSNKFVADKDKIKEALPWLASVIERHRII